MAKSKPREPMPVSERAKQFSPFSPLKGLSEALAEKEKIRVPMKEVSEDAAAQINRILQGLKRGEMITAVYYDLPEQQYAQLTGAVDQVDMIGRVLHIGLTVINFDALYAIILHGENE